MLKTFALALVGLVLLAGCSSMTGKTTSDTVDDAQITAAVKTKLAQEKMGSITRIDVDTSLGTVYLTGVAETAAFRDRATAVAREVRGVRQVVNNVSIQAPSAAAGSSRTTGQVIDDATITAAVKTKLAAEKLSTLTKVNVDTRNGVVTLTGNVDTETTRQRALDVARGVDGVRDVISNLRIGS
jgi:hyperosmotically inducible protein